MTTVMLFAASTAVATLIGGTAAFRLRERTHLVLAFTSGALLGIVCFDLLPELFALSHRQDVDVQSGMAALVVGFLLLYGIGRFAVPAEPRADRHHHPRIGLLSALALVGHSFSDGVGIGLGFRISEAIGTVVAAAVIAHDFADGFNTVTLMVTHDNTRHRSLVLLLLDAGAPVTGALLALSVPIPEHLMTLYLGFFAGCLLHIATTHLSPEDGHRNGSRGAEIALICTGVAFARLVQSAVPQGSP